MKYNADQLNEAKQMVSDLQNASNKRLRFIANRRVTDSNRQSVIIDILTEEYGDDILKHNLVKVFGDDKFTKKHEAKR